MNIILSFSPTNQSYHIAQYFAKQLSWDIYDITSHINQSKFDYQKEYQYVIITFPVYSQSIPLPLIKVLKNIKGKYFILIATYGKMGTGDVLYDARRLIKGEIIGAAYIPSRHSYKDNHEFTEFDKLETLLRRINTTTAINIPKRKRHMLAKVFPNLRSRLNVRLKVNNKCIKCNHCNSICPTNAINNGRINNKCIRCLRCYYECPIKGLDVKYALPLRMYLKKDKLNQLIIY